MLGALARWLRLLGLDTVYLTGPPTVPLAGRTLITRRSNRPHQPRLDSWDRVIRITANLTPYQVVETVRALDLRRQEIAPLTRCSLCNHPLTDVPPVILADKVPEYVLKTQETFRQCFQCGRIYWAGTHQQRMSEMIEQLWTEDGLPRSNPLDQAESYSI